MWPGGARELFGIHLKAAGSADAWDSPWDRMVKSGPLFTSGPQAQNLLGIHLGSTWSGNARRSSVWDALQWYQ
ncbi:unnamed protein product [Angiostrongylus costaricensis]|uniref:Uncharacterized protein n=1 Tax=Angiostrongylus costaricensis TaxID=334426 RepID=A0A0R3PQI1_ANGCS|nr:unnamed protein product [Angiostrongylus costaricensis]